MVRAIELGYHQKEVAEIHQYQRQVEAISRKISSAAVKRLGDREKSSGPLYIDEQSLATRANKTKKPLWGARPPPTIRKSAAGLDDS